MLAWGLKEHFPMKEHASKKFLAAALLGTLSCPALAADRPKGMGVGAGVAYAASNHALIVNPASLTDSGDGISVEGLWQFTPADPLVSAVAAYDHLGIGGGYRKSGSLSIYEGGFGARLGDIAGLGATVRSVEGSGLDGDLGLTLDFGKLRLAGVAHGISNGPDRVDAGLGVHLQDVILEVDLKKPRPFDSSIWYVDTSITASVSKVSVGVGYDFTRTSAGTSNGGLHAGVSLNVLSKLYLEAYYRLLAQEIGADKWTAGARYVF